jgi:F0F1-type ATP synthase epsilon subunit
MSPNATPQLQVKIINPDQTLYQGPAQAVSSTNNQGQFDILHSHSHFISIIKNQLIVHLPNQTTKTFKFKQGVLRCFDNQIKIYIGL